ncbi:hypothetical protein P9112_005377 [Eukaryota sp. TZLM1-RC]
MIDIIPPVLLIVLFSITVSSLSEFLGWLFVYRTSKYRSQKERLAAKLKEWQEKPPTDQKKLKKLEDTIKQENQQVQMMKFKGTFFLGIIMIVAYRVLSKRFLGVVVAKLPFEPIKMIRGLSHRRLEGTDWTDCSFSFIYALCSASLRANIVKYFGFQPPKLPQELTMAGSAAAQQ